MKQNFKKNLIFRDIIIKPRPTNKWERKILMNKENKEFFFLYKNTKNPILKKYYKFKFFLRWAIKLLVPDFLIGHPSLWDNLKTLRKHPHFKPLRMAFTAWLIFTITVGSTGIYTFINLPKTEAAGNFSIRTGYYLGDGVPFSVTGLGFSPELVIIKSDTAAGQLVWKSSAMPDNVSTYLGVATADNTETEITLDSDGFSLSAALEINTNKVRYLWVALAGSDCSSEGTMCLGSYTGDGTSSQIINTGFQPDLVWVKRTTAIVGNFTTSSMTPTHAGFFSAAANDSTGVYFKSLDAGGTFTVGATNNTNGGVFYFVAFKNIATQLKVGSFLGDGVDGKNISGVGFEPDFVLVKQNSAIVPAFNTTECYGDFSNFTTAAAGAVNHIQSLDSDGFQVGNSTSVNSTGIISHWFAFGGAPDISTSGSFFMEKGSYDGNGTTQFIETSFEPSLVFIKGDTTQFGVWSSRMDYDQTHYFASATVAFTGGITSFNSTGFNIGNHATVNNNLVKYEYVAFGNATGSRKGGGASDFILGTYTGNGLSPRVIDHLGVAPDMIFIKPPAVAASSNINVWSSSSMPANTTSYVTATADITDGTGIRSLDDENGGGFTIGSGARVNTAAVTYSFFGFKEGAGIFDVGSYTGNSTPDREITGVGFSPDFIWTKGAGATVAVHRSSSPTIAENYSQHFLALNNDTNDIKSFTADGFILGNSAEVNTTGDYRYAAWKSTNSGYAPDTPTNSTPSNGAITQDLNVTLGSSNYSDSDVPPNTHIDTQWQVDDDSDFATPVWTRTSGVAEITTSVTSGNGTFMNELVGKTELNHNSTYYWRVRYSDGVWSNWSTSTNFITNIINTPTNSSPINEGTVTTLTPTLTASAFSDEQSGHTSLSAQWQISTSDDFSSPFYDSGIISYGNSFAVPSATLSDKFVYYWHVRYKDSSGQWSPYSTTTRFLVSKSEVSVNPLFGSTVIDQGDIINIDAQVKLLDGTVINDATVTISVFNPSGTKIVNEQPMVYIPNSNGVYRYPSFTVPATSGSYLYEVTAVSGGVSGFGAANFEVRTIASDVSDTKVNVEEIEVMATDIQNNIDILIGALIVTQSTVNDPAGSTTSFITSLTNPTNDFYKNAVLTFTSGALNGQLRRISSYNGTTKTITVDPALTSAPANGDAFTITKQNVRVEEQASLIKTVVDDTNTKVTDIQSKVNAIQTELGTINTNLSTLQSTVNTIRASQQKMYTLKLSDVSEMQPDSNYRSTLTVRDYEGNPVDLGQAPTIVIYNSLRAEALPETSMTKVAGTTGVYEYVYAIPSGVVSGLWEAVVRIDTEGADDNILNDYWQVTGSPAQVLVNSVTVNGLDNVLADITITNEGNSEYEYHYEYCIVDSSDNACGGNDDIFHGTGSKLIGQGIDYNTIIPVPPAPPMSVPIAGTYYFKLVVNYGTESSGASLQFTATEEENLPIISSGGGGSQVITLETLYNEMQAMRGELQVESGKLTKTLSLIGNVDLNSPGFKSLLAINTSNTEDLKGIQNRISDLRAVSSVAQKLIDQNSSAPIVETYMKFNSVEINFIITNPLKEAQTVKFSAFLPEEARPENILDSSGLKVEYDPSAKTYFVSGEIDLGPKQTITKKIEMKDIWVFDETELNLIKQQAIDIVKTFSGTQFESQGIILQGDIEATINMILSKQKASYSSPQDHIVVYRENKDRVAKVQNEFDQLKSLVTQANSSKSIIGNIGGIQTFATWGIIIAIFFGFALLAIVIFAMWRHQTMLTMKAMGLKRKEDNPIKEGEV